MDKNAFTRLIKWIIVAMPPAGLSVAITILTLYVNAPQIFPPNTVLISLLNMAVCTMGTICSFNIIVFPDNKKGKEINETNSL